MRTRTIKSSSWCILCASILFSTHSHADRDLTPPDYVFTPDIPHDMVTQNVGAIGFQPFVDNLAWSTFIALNWPVPEQLKERGVPDRQNVIGGFRQQGEGGTTSMPVGPVVWETFKDTEDIFLDPPVAPEPFDSPELVPDACKTLATAHPGAARRTMTETAKVSEVLRETDQAFSGAPLIDQNGKKVWYEVKVNKVYFDYVVDNQFYIKEKQQGVKIAFPASSNTARGEATVKVKAAWKVLGDKNSHQPDNPDIFYTVDALTYDKETETCTMQPMGLVGLHVVMKTEQLPQWMWATFEHVDNAPDMGTTPEPGKQYNFFDPTCTDCLPNAKPETGSDKPVQVERVVPVDSFAPNSTFQQALKNLRDDNVWQNYMLVNTQWGASPTPIGVPNQPKYLANAVIETYLQEEIEDKGSPHGCINCHGFAADSDLDFQLGKASSAKK